jgi:ABC-type dipeptide/oligopeptide/nickel transport system permease subunit
MVTRKGVQFQYKRLSGTASRLFKNKMSTVGIILLAGFVFAAFAAPLLTPYTPGIVVAGTYAQPEWVTNFPDGYYLSKNMVIVNDPLFNSPSSIQAWTLTAPTSTLANTQISYAQGVSSRSDSHGSLQMAYSGQSTGVATVSQTFQYPYHGPPKRFIASAAFLLSGASQSNPVYVRLFIHRADGTTFNLLNDSETTNGQWVPPPTISLDSNSGYLQGALGTFGTGFSAPQIVFSGLESYTYGVEVTFSGPAKINIDDLQLRLLGSAWGLLGSDYGGSDVFSQFVYGARVSLLVGLLSAGIGISLGLVVGLLAGFLGRLVDEVLMRFTDMLLVIPGLPLLIVLVAVLGPNIWNLILIIGFLGWMGFARIVRSQVLTLRERPFVEAAKAAGAGPGRIITRHIFPNIVSLTYVNLALTVPGAILAESALAFLGLSDPSVNSWGHMFYNVETSGSLSTFPPPWWWVLPPGIGIALVSLSFVLIGYALDEIFNPRLRRRQ